MSNFIDNIKKWSIGKKTYTLLWLLTGIIMVVLVFLLSFAPQIATSMGNNPSANFLAVWSLVFFLLLVASIVTTVVFSVIDKNKKIVVKGGK